MRCSARKEKFMENQEKIKQLQLENSVLKDEVKELQGALKSTQTHLEEAITKRSLDEYKKISSLNYLFD